MKQLYIVCVRHLFLQRSLNLYICSLIFLILKMIMSLYNFQSFNLQTYLDRIAKPIEWRVEIADEKIVHVQVSEMSVNYMILQLFRAVSEELTKKDDLALLFIATSSIVNKSNSMWRKVRIILFLIKWFLLWINEHVDKCDWVDCFFWDMLWYTGDIRREKSVECRH